jgi:hypothetical protein
LSVLAGSRRNCAAHFEGIAGRDSSLLQSAFEPADTLRGGTVGEAFGTYCSALHSLQMIVADGCGGLQTSCDIGVVNDVALFGAMSPHTGEAIGLQLKVNGEGISLRRILPG